MSLTFDITCRNAQHTTFDALQIDCVLTNGSSAPVALPGADDRTGALTLHVYDAATGALVRRMNGLSNQAMMSRSRIDLSPSLDVVAVGQRLAWTLDLASFHYPLSAGRFEIEATFDYPPAEAALTSRRVPVTVSSVEIHSMSALHDNPVLDGTALLFGTEDGALRLRQHNHARPLAAWYTRTLDLQANGTSPFLASAGFFNTDSFDHFFSKWIVFQRGDEVFAREYLWGEPTEWRRTASLPARGTLCRSAFTTATGEMFVFFQSPTMLEGYRFDETALAKVLEQGLPPGVPEAEIRADDEHIHVLIADRGLVHHRFKLNGEPDGNTRIVRTSMLPVRYAYEPADRVVKAIFRDQAASQSMLLVFADAEGVTSRLMKLAVPGDIEEIDFDRSPGGRFIVVVSTSRKSLYLFDEERGPVQLATGEQRYHPRVIARRVTYVGHFRKDHGYRFATFSWKRRPSRLVDYDLAAWEQP